MTWVSEHLRITKSYEFNRVPLSGYGCHGGKHRSHAWGQRWARIAGLPKSALFKGRQLRQFIPGELT